MAVLTKDNVLSCLGLPDDDIFSHAPAATVTEQIDELKKLGCADSDRITKNLFLKDTRSRYYLCTALQSTSVPFEKALGIRLGLKKNELRMAPQEEMLEALNVAPGSATPLATCQPSASRVILLLHQQLREAPFYVHPLSNAQSVRLSAEALEAFLAKHGRQPHWVDLSVKDVKVGPGSPPDLKAIADSLPEIKVKAQAAAPPAAATKKDKKDAKAPKQGTATPSNNENAYEPSSVQCCLGKLMAVVEGCVGQAVAQQAPLSVKQKGVLQRDLEVYLSSLQNASYAAGLASGTESASAKALGTWR